MLVLIKNNKFTTMQVVIVDNIEKAIWVETSIYWLIVGQ